MVHAPHSPMPQPYLVPTRPSASRSTQSIGVSGVTSTDRDWPFTRSVYVLMVPRRRLAAKPGGRPAPNAKPDPYRHSTRNPSESPSPAESASLSGRPCFGGDHDSPEDVSAIHAFDRF